jgi:hypothetical protein
VTSNLARSSHRTDAFHCAHAECSSALHGRYHPRGSAHQAQNLLGCKFVTCCVNGQSTQVLPHHLTVLVRRAFHTAFPRGPRESLELLQFWSVATKSADESSFFVEGEPHDSSHQPLRKFLWKSLVRTTTIPRAIADRLL